MDSRDNTNLRHCSIPWLNIYTWLNIGHKCEVTLNHFIPFHDEHYNSCGHDRASTFFEPRHDISNNVVCATSKASDPPAHTRSLIRAFASSLNILLTEHHLKFLSSKGGLHRLVCVYTCQNGTLLEITCRGSYHNLSIFQDIKQKAHSHNVYVSPEPILFMMFNMKSISIAFPKHTNYVDICIINVFYQEVEEGRAITSHINSVIPMHLQGLVICII